MADKNELFKMEDRYCPICGSFIKSDSPTHRCLEEDIQKIEEEEKITELYDTEAEDYDLDRSYDDRLNEFDELYNSDNYYDNDIEEE
jgi:hypothetical protein